MMYANGMPPKPGPRRLISLQDVSVQAGGGQPREILSGISHTLEGRQITLVIGKTGAGKSTLLQTAAGLIPTHTGRVLFDDQPLWNNGRVSRDVLKQIGYVFQYPEQQLFTNTVQGEFDFSLKPYGLSTAEGKRRIEEALVQVGLPSAVLNRAPLTLSGGQKRRIALATTLATEPDWLFLDEPTAGLDGTAVQALLSQLIAWRSHHEGGIVIATHDLDAFFPIADQVLILQDGRIMQVAEPAWLCQHSEVLMKANIGLPICVQTVREMASHGISLETGLYTPDELATRIIDARNKQVETTAVPVQCQAEFAASTLAQMEPNADSVVLQGGTSNKHVIPNTCEHQIDNPPQVEVLDTGALHALDPRSKWVCYVLLSAAILFQHQWQGIICATGLVAVVFHFARMSARQGLQAVRPFLWLILLSVGLSGLRISVHHGVPPRQWIGFSLPLAEVTFQYLYNLLLVMILGAILAFTTTQLAMKRGLEQGLSFLQRVRFPVAAFSLGTSLILRFIPVILGEVQRFMVIVRARGKSGVRPGRIRMHDIPALVIPLLLSVFQFGEDISLAMEARGYTHIRPRSTTAVLKMKRPDWIAMAACVVLVCVMWTIGRL